MYLSHPVRRMCADPLPEELATLVVELADRDGDDFRAAVGDLGGDVEAALPFESYRVALPEEAVAELCALDGLAVVETVDAVGYGGDSGEDVEHGTTE